MKRRAFISLRGGAAAAWPLAARAQQPRRIGVLLAGDPTDPENQNRTNALEAGLRDLGWISGRNLAASRRAWVFLDELYLLRKLDLVAAMAASAAAGVVCRLLGQSGHPRPIGSDGLRRE